MAEEFQEAEVMFDQNYDTYSDTDSDSDSSDSSSNSIIRETNKRKKQKKTAEATEVVKSSVPVNIPVNVNRNAWLRFDMDDEGAAGEMVPPHVIIGRRVAAKVVAFSVCTGKGRTLKGRDLSEVRNSILRMTGFLET